MTTIYVQRLCKALAGALIALMGGAAWSCPGGTDVARAHGAWFSRAVWTGTGATAEGDFVLDGANANPSGIAFGEGRFHVLDWLDRILQIGVHRDRLSPGRLARAVMSM